MGNVLRDLLGAPKWAWPAVLLFVILLTLGLSGAYTSTASVWLVVSSFLASSIYLASVILSAGRKGHKHVPSVCVWSIVWLLSAVGTFFYWYFRWDFGNDQESLDRILNIVPVLTAIVAAGLGWYVHYQFSAKSQRTNSSFALVMEMQKSAEYLKRNDLVRDHFPPSLDDIPDIYKPHFPVGSIKRIQDEAKAANRAPDQDELDRAEAIAALRYILNYYEFMAVGARSNDLDCDLLVETVGQIVIGRYNRSKSFVEWIRAPKPQGQGQALAFEHLEVIAREWSHRVEEQESLARKKRLQGN